MAGTPNQAVARVVDVIAGTAAGTGTDFAAFARILLSRAPAEDLAPYDADALTRSARLALDAMKRHRPGATVVDMSPTSLVGRGARPVTVVTVVNDNMPFLYNSITGEINDRSGIVHLVLHPILDVRHSPQGAELVGEAHGATPPEGTDRISLMQVHVPEIDEASRQALAARLETILSQVRSAVTDWSAMLGRLAEAIEDYRSTPASLERGAVDEAVAFLEWLRNNNFTFLGMREYEYVADSAEGELAASDVPPLGILRDPDVRVLRRGEAGAVTSPEILAFLHGPEPLIITKANTRSLVHRRAYLDYIGIKRFGPDGRLKAELRIVGLFTSTVYTHSVSDIPVLRSKVRAVITRLGFNPEDHSGKALLNVLESYPRDELFQIDVETLTTNAELILALVERPRVRVMPRIDPFNRFVSVIVFVPRDRYDSQVREKIGAYLKTVYEGRVSAYYPAFPEGPLARVHFIIGHSGDAIPDVAREKLEADVLAIVRTWEDAVREAALETGRDRYAALAARFPDSYRETFSPAEALVDAERISGLSPDDALFIDFYRHREDSDLSVALKIYHYGAPVVLSERVPLLENMGFRVISEQTFELPSADGTAQVHVHDMQLVSQSGGSIDVGGGELLEEVFRSAWSGTAGNDGYNALVQTAKLSSTEITILRAYGSYLRQVGVPYSQSFIAATLNRYPEIARNIHALFDLRFNPEREDERNTHGPEQIIHAAIDEELQGVPSLDDDRIIRRFLNLVGASLRTNAYALADDGPEPRRTLAIKLDSHAVEGLPEPRPYREIFVYGQDVEGIHLRFGPVARGGIRWSDRAQDYRTEVLGLVKAQQVKNAVIVPVGAKGGFYPRRLPQGGSREAIFEAGRAAYVTFIKSLLSVTDNLDAGKVIPPEGVVRHDSDDPYFVVAADKGTATFSDTANAISQEHGFWLDDAFASGGSAGYDHKKMGITARGAWEAVKRHFREMDRDIQKTQFTAVGVGDMSGDVFGNGMLLSAQTRLVAAFDHRDIFIDPDPDPSASFVERQRLFQLARSSWQDYDRTKLSQGGAVFSRGQKSIMLSDEAAAAIGLDKTMATPFEVISAILKAPVDLLWFGGIGTYVRATSETDAEAGDRTNDPIRVTAHDVRAKVIGEGANLGVTQRARIEYGLLGGRCDSDAIDNSAGVNTSDVEVNIKIALAHAMRTRKLERPARDVLLAAMTNEVGQLVLRNNYLQTLAISLTRKRGLADLAYQARFMADLEGRGLLDRKVETLPDEQALAERQVRGQPLTRAEIGVLLAYAKIVLFDQLIASPLPDEPYLETDLLDYFPSEMRELYAREIREHPLRREIIATALANDVINRGGPTFVSRLQDLTGKSPEAIVAAYVAIRDGFLLGDVLAELDQLDNAVPGDAQNELYMAVTGVIQAETGWLVHNGMHEEPLADVVTRLRTARRTLEPRLGELMPAFMNGQVEAEAQRFAGLGAPQVLAGELARLQVNAIVPDIALVAETARTELETAAHAYFGITEYFRIANIEDAARSIPVTDYYDGLALSRASDVIVQARRAIACAAIDRFGFVDNPVETWFGEDRERIDGVRRRMVALTEAGELTVSRLTVAAGLMADLAAG